MELVTSERTSKSFLLTPNGLYYNAHLNPEVLQRLGYSTQTIDTNHPNPLSPTISAVKHILFANTATNPTLFGSKNPTELQVLWGSAFLLGVRPDGKIVESYIEEAEEMVGLVRDGWLVTTIAGEKGATVLETTIEPSLKIFKQSVPPGTLRMGQKNIPPTYWELYRRYTTPR